jgi:hypothetical protein
MISFWEASYPGLRPFTELETQKVDFDWFTRQVM